MSDEPKYPPQLVCEPREFTDAELDEWRQRFRLTNATVAAQIIDAFKRARSRIAELEALSEEAAEIIDWWEHGQTSKQTREIWARQDAERKAKEPK